MIQKDEIEHIGWLARIELSETEKGVFEAHFNSIFDYFAVLDELDTEDVHDDALETAPQPKNN